MDREYHDNTWEANLYICNKESLVIYTFFKKNVIYLKICPNFIFILILNSILLLNFKS